MQIQEGGGSCQCELSPKNYWKAYPDFQKERGIQKWAEIVVEKVEKDQEQHKKTIIWIKGTAVKFHKSSVTYWAKAVLQPKNKQQFAAITQSVGIADQEITSVLKLLYFAFTTKPISNYLIPLSLFNIGSKIADDSSQIYFLRHIRRTFFLVFISADCNWWLWNCIQRNMENLPIKRSFFLAFISADCNHWLWNKIKITLLNISVIGGGRVDVKFFENLQ